MTKLGVDPGTPPLAKSYLARVVLALSALCPFIVATTAAAMFRPTLMIELHADRLDLQIVDSLSDAAYAFGAVVAIALVRRHPPRRLFLVYEAAVVAGFCLAAAAPNVEVYGSGRVLQGFATGLLLVAALPPLITGFPVRKLPVTAAVVDIGLFGATALGPLVGGDSASPVAWRVMLAALAAIAGLGLCLAYLSIEQGDPLDRDGRPDVYAIPLALLATVVPFFGAAELTGQVAGLPLAYGCLAAGGLFLVGLLVVEYRRPKPLTPVKLLSRTVPVVGIVAAMTCGAVSVGLLELTETFLLQAWHLQPSSAGAALWPQVAGVLVAAVIFGCLFRRRVMPGLIIGGALALAVGGWLLAGFTASTTHATIFATAALVGFGAGATVSPGLFMAGLSCPSSQLGPAFALVELLRSEAAFLFAPIVLKLVLAEGAKPAQLVAGVDHSAAVVLVLLGAGLGLAGILWLIGRPKLQKPDLQAWLDEGDEAVDSPPLAGAFR